MRGSPKKYSGRKPKTIGMRTTVPEGEPLYLVTFQCTDATKAVVKRSQRRCQQDYA